MEFRKKLLTEKYRPSDLDGIALPDKVMDIFENGIQTNVLLYGPPGTGKTSLAKMLVSHFGNSYLYINASSEGRIDYIRNEIREFCSSSDLLSSGTKYKVVILDEVDGASSSFFNAFRGTVEEFSSNTRFILTCNYIDKIPEAIQSRFNAINFNFTGNDYIEVFKKVNNIISGICKIEGVEFKEESLKFKFIQKHFPKIRNMLVQIEQWVQSGVEMVEDENIQDFISDYKDIYEAIFSSNDPIKNNELLGKFIGSEDDIIRSLGSELFEYIREEKSENQDLIFPMASIICNYQYKMNFSIDKYVCLLACFHDLQKLLFEYNNKK